MHEKQSCVFYSSPMRRIQSSKCHKVSCARGTLLKRSSKLIATVYKNILRRSRNWPLKETRENNSDVPNNLASFFWVHGSFMLLQRFYYLGHIALGWRKHQTFSLETFATSKLEAAAACCGDEHPTPPANFVKDFCVASPVALERIDVTSSATLTRIHTPYSEFWKKKKFKCHNA